MLNRLITFAFIVFITHISFGQKNNFTNYTIRDGLPQNTVYKIFQDSKGYLWLATDGGGVSRFDGRKHKYFKKKDGLSSNVVRDIIEDDNGKLWFATNEGISIYDGETFLSINEENGLISNSVVKLFQDSKNRLWAGTTSGGLSNVSISDSIKVINYTPDDGLSSENVFTIIEDEYSRLWLAYIGGPPQILSFKDEKLIVNNINISQNYDLSALYCSSIDKQGNIWFGSIYNGVFKFENIDTNNSPTITNYSIMSGLKDNYVLDIMVADSTIWIATNDGGVHYLENNEINNINEEDGLAGNQVLDILSDYEGNIWFSCMGEGIQKLNGFEFSHYSEKDNLLSNQISYIKNNELDSSIWIGSYDNGIQKIKIKEDDIIELEHILNDNKLFKSVKSFDFDRNGNLWIGTQNGLVVWNEEILATVNSEFIAGDKINSILCASSGWVWIGTSSGLSFYNGEYGVFTEDQGFINNEIQTIIEGSDGTIWIGTLGGLASYKDEIMITYDAVEGLTNLQVHSLAEAANGNIIIGTYGGGLFYLNRMKDTSQITPLLKPNRLISPNIYSLCFQSESTLYVGTDKGVDKIGFDPEFKLKSIKHFTQNNGFLPIENNINAVAINTKIAKIFFGTVNGLTSYDYLEKNEKSPSPRIILEDIRLFNQSIEWEDYGKVDNNFLPLELVLPYNENFISFSFSTINFKNPNNISYEYRLVGLNDDWFTSQNNDIVYQGLEPNTYSLEVKSITENGLESRVYKFDFELTPPFYKTWWFYSLSFLFISICIVIVFQLNLRRLRREKIILENTVKIRTKEIVEQKNIIEEKNQEIMDSITYAKGIQKAILPDEPKLNKYFEDFLVLFNPKDIVSGDFYWAHKKNNKYYFMAADCTGHGVPGAIMSVIGHTSLETTLKHPDELTAGEFLDLLNQNVLDILLQSEEHSVKDGMDVALCIYDSENNTLEYAGANNPLYLIRDSKLGFSSDLQEERMVLNDEKHHLFEFKANKQPIGDYEHRTKFDTHSIKIESGDTVYVFSDGFPDQFGGKKGKKYMYKPFKRFLLSIQSNSLKEQSKLLDKELYQWMNPAETKEEHEQVDDVLIFGIRFK